VHEATGHSGRLNGFAASEVERRWSGARLVERLMPRPLEVDRVDQDHVQVGEGHRGNDVVDLLAGLLAHPGVDIVDNRFKVAKVRDTEFGIVGWAHGLYVLRAILEPMICPDPVGHKEFRLACSPLVRLVAHLAKWQRARQRAVGRGEVQIGGDAERVRHCLLGRPLRPRIDHA